MKQRAHIRLQFVGHRPRILVAEPYYTPVAVVQTAAGALGVFASIIGGTAAVIGNGVIGPLLGLAAVCLLFFLGVELLVVRVDSLLNGTRISRSGRLTARSAKSRKASDPVPLFTSMRPTSGFEITGLLCRLGRHAYHPQGTTTEDRLGITPRPQPPRMVWRCARCGDEQWLTPGISPE